MSLLHLQLYRIAVGERWLHKQCNALVGFDGEFASKEDAVTLTEGHASLLDSSGVLTLTVHVLRCITVSHVTVSAYLYRSSITASMLQLPIDAKQPATHAALIDAEKQHWHLFAYATKNPFAFALVYTDSKNIPQGYCRHVCVSGAFRFEKKTSTTIPTGSIVSVDRRGDDSPLVDCPHSCYFTSTMRQQDNRIVMMSAIPVESVNSLFDQRFYKSSLQLHSTSNKWLNSYDSRATVEIEWIASYLLAHPNYTINDDIIRRHLMQMRCAFSKRLFVKIIH